MKNDVVLNERPDDAELAGSGACELALTVEERGAGQFYWVVLQAANDESQDVMVYRRVEMAARALQSYSNALIVGAAVVRRLTGT